MVDISDNLRWALGSILALYVAGLLVLSLFASKKVKSDEDYLVAGRRLPLFLAWGTLIATWFGAATMMGAAQAARDEGLLGVTLDPFACSATLVVAGLFFAKPLWRMKLYTISDFYRNKYGTRAEVLASAIQVAGYFGWIAAQYVALAAVQRAYFGVELKYGILIGAGITLCYTVIGGMWSVTLTDTAQITIALVGLILLGETTFSQLGGGSFLEGVNRMLDETPSDYLALVPVAGTAAALAWCGDWLNGLFGNIPGQDLQQRVFAARDEKTASRACILAGIAYFCFGIIPVSLGLVSNLTDPGAADVKILPLLAGKYLSPLIAVVFVVSLVSIVVSTATSAVLAPATVLGHNLLGRLRFAQGRELLRDRLCVLLIGAVGIALAYSEDRIMGLLDMSLSIGLAGLFVPLLAGLYGKPRGELSALLSMGLGFVVWLARYMLEEFVLPLSEAAEAAGVGYADYVAGALPAERVGDLFHSLVYLFALVPADLWGLAASFCGYFLGQWLLSRRASHS